MCSKWRQTRQNPRSKKLFSVTVLSVNTIVVKGKKKRMGKFAGYRSDWKKAIVKIMTGQTIAKFGEV